MPRITKEEKARNRQNIVDAAGRLFRAQGIDAVGVDALMKEAGLTHGGFYNHFPSKNALVVAVCEASFAASLGALAQSVQDRPDAAGSPLERLVADYLSTVHRDSEDGGCPSAALVSDAGRHADDIQAAYAQGLEGYLSGISAEIIREAREAGEQIDSPEARTRATRLFSELVGSMVLARAVRRVQPELSDELLRASREHLLD